jgi:molecular chaperone DnaK
VLRDQGDTVGADERAAVEGPLSDLKKALEGNDTAAIKSSTDALMQASQAFSQKLYEAAARDANAAGSSASGQAGGTSGGATDGGDDDIVDAEIVDEEQ